VLCNLLLLSVCNQWHSLWGLVFSLDFCLISIGWSYDSNVSVYSGITFQPMHCIVSLKNLSVALKSSSVLREHLVFH
jgi:hypothetical protein